jgi:hypothetical protein
MRDGVDVSEIGERINSHVVPLNHEMQERHALMEQRFSPNPRTYIRGSGEKNGERA